MKTAVVFYSYDGNCAFVAERIGALMNADLLCLRTKDEKRRCRVGRFFAACAMLLFQRRPALKPFDFDPTAYDLIIIGAPVWAASPAPPVQTFLSQVGITGKKGGSFCLSCRRHGNGLGEIQNPASG